MSINDAFAKNMTGKTIKFDVQPYSAGTGVISNISIRRIENVKTFDGRLGTVIQTYEVFDLTVDVEEGHHVGALIGGVPVRETVKNTAGKQEFVVGVSYGELYEAVVNGKTIVKASCG